MKIVVNYDSDCKACFDNLLYSLLDLKNKNQVNEFLYKPFSKVIIDSDMEKDELIKFLNNDSPVEHKFSRFENITDSQFEEYKKDFNPYTKSLFD